MQCSAVQCNPQPRSLLQPRLLSSLADSTQRAAVIAQCTDLQHQGQRARGKVRFASPPTTASGCNRHNKGGHALVRPPVPARPHRRKLPALRHCQGDWAVRRAVLCAKQARKRVAIHALQHLQGAACQAHATAVGACRCSSTGALQADKA